MVASACAEAEPPRLPDAGPVDSAPTVTDSSAYHFRAVDDRFEGTIRATFRNATPDTVQFLNCNGVTSASLEWLMADTWIDVWHSEQDACYSAPIVVAPGAAVQQTVHVMGGRWRRVEDRALSAGDTIGVHRLLWTALVPRVATATPGQEPLPHALRISTPFVLIVTP